MKRSLLVFLGISNLLLATEFDYGVGTFSMKGGFLGLESSIDADISTYSLVTRHANIAGDFFYGYDFTWYDSDTLKQAQQSYNNLANSSNDMLNRTGMGGVGGNSALSIPSMDYRFQGLDANIRAGYDIWHQDQDNFFGVGALLGISLPWIDSSKSDDSSSNTNSNLLGAFPDTKTDIKTYKLGATISFQKSLISDKVSIYGVGSYAYQTGEIDNDYVDGSYSVDGTFQEYNVGLYFTPFTEEFKWGFLTLSPRVYATLGYRYSKWSVDKMVIDTSGGSFNSDQLSQFEKDFEMSSSIGYFGVGYSF